MQTLSTLLTITFVIVSALLMLVIMIQNNRSSGMGLFGGSGSQSAFGASSGDVLTKLTGYLTAAFMILALTLAYMKSRESSLLGVSGEVNNEATVNHDANTPIKPIQPGSPETTPTDPPKTTP